MEVGPLAIEAVDAAAETITMAFRHDPVWNVALVAADGSEGHLLPYWRLYVEGARRYDTVFASADAGAVSVWIHPEDPSCRMTRRPRCANWPSARSVRGKRLRSSSSGTVSTSTTPPGGARLPEPAGHAAGHAAHAIPAGPGAGVDGPDS